MLRKQNVRRAIGDAGPAATFESATPGTATVALATCAGDERSPLVRKPGLNIGRRLGQLFLFGVLASCSRALIARADTTAADTLEVTKFSAAEKRDGSHDFDFLIGDWKVHVRGLRGRLNGSNDWIECDGISNHKKLLDSNANFEQFDATCTAQHKRNKGQALRLYNPETHQWSIYLVDLDKGTLDLPPVTGHFTGNRGEFYNQDHDKGRAIYVRYVWINVSPKSAHFEQSWSADGGKTWEPNWICDLSR